MATRRRRRNRKRPRKRGAAVSIHLPARPLAYSDATIVIRRNGRKFGELRISQGGVDWNPRYGKRPRKFRWARLARRLDQG